MVDKVPPIVIEIFNLKIETDEAICDYVIIMDIISERLEAGGITTSEGQEEEGND